MAASSDLDQHGLSLAPLHFSVRGSIPYAQGSHDLLLVVDQLAAVRFLRCQQTLPETHKPSTIHGSSIVRPDCGYFMHTISTDHINHILLSLQILLHQYLLID